jgi:CspA family cold shock protein
MVQGTVKWFNSIKAFGFIQPDEKINRIDKKENRRGNNNYDIFVHISALPNGTTLQEGNRVNFELEENNGKRSAVNVEVI